MKRKMRQNPNSQRGWANTEMPSTLLNMYRDKLMPHMTARKAANCKQESNVAWQNSKRL